MSGRPLRRAREAQMLANGGAVPLNTYGVSRFVEASVIPALVDRLHHLPQGQPIGEEAFELATTFVVEEHGSGPAVPVTVVLSSRPTSNSTDLLSGGKLDRNTSPWTVVVYFSASKSPRELLARADVPPAGKNDGATLGPAILSVLIHEFTHVLDFRFPQRLSYKTVGGKLNVGRVAYINDSVEVRAFIQQTVHECVLAARLPEVRSSAAGAPSPNEALVNECLEHSRTWWTNSQFFRQKNMNRLLAATLREFDRQGLLFK